MPSSSRPVKSSPPNAIMAESVNNKRLSLSGRVATPRLSTTPHSIPMDAVLARCHGAKIQVQTTAPASRTVTGHIFALALSSPVLTLTSHPVLPNPATPLIAPRTSFTIIPLSSIQKFTLLELVSSQTPATPTSPTNNANNSASRIVAPAPLGPIDTSAAQNRMQATIARLQAEEARRGKGVSREAQQIFDALSRTMSVRWDGERIVVLDTVVISPPYGAGDCRAGKGAGAQALPRIRKVLESEKKKLASASGGQPLSRGGSGTELKKGG